MTLFSLDWKRCPLLLGSGFWFGFDLRSRSLWDETTCCFVIIFIGRAETIWLGVFGSSLGLINWLASSFKRIGSSWDMLSYHFPWAFPLESTLFYWCRVAMRGPVIWISAALYLWSFTILQHSKCRIDCFPCSPHLLSRINSMYCTKAHTLLIDKILQSLCLRWRWTLHLPLNHATWLTDAIIW